MFEKRYPIEALLSETIADLKQRVHAQANMAIDDKRYFKYHNRELDDSQRLSDCNFQAAGLNEILWLERNIRGRGGSAMQIFLKVFPHSAICLL